VELFTPGKKTIVMKFKFFSAVAVVLLFGCKNKNHVAVNYNNMIVEQQNILKTGMDEEEPKLKSYFVIFEYDSIVSASARMETRIDAIIQQIQKEPAPKVEQGENFKKVALNYFNYFKAVYDSYKNYGLQTEAKSRLYAAQDMAIILSDENKRVADVKEAQRIFAKDNNFKIKGISQNNSLVKK
jgi:hypothetical protein